MTNELQNANDTQQASEQLQKRPLSMFTGSIWGLLGITLLQYLIIIASLGIATTWAICVYQRWVTKHTIVDGHTLRFDGDGSSIFWRFLVWALLTLVTAGIYGWWMAINLKRWITENTHLGN